MPPTLSSLGAESDNSQRHAVSNGQGDSARVFLLVTRIIPREQELRTRSLSLIAPRVFVPHQGLARRYCRCLSRVSAHRLTTCLPTGREEGFAVKAVQAAGCLFRKVEIVKRLPQNLIYFGSKKSEGNFWITSPIA